MQWNGENMDDWKARAKMTGLNCFAYLPTQMENGRWIWWEPYVAKAYPNLRGGLNWENFLPDDPDLMRDRHYARPPAPTPTRPKPDLPQTSLNPLHKLRLLRGALAGFGDHTMASEDFPGHVLIPVTQYDAIRYAMNITADEAHQIPPPLRDTSVGQEKSEPGALIPPCNCHPLGLHVSYRGRQSRCPRREPPP